MAAWLESSQAAEQDNRVRIPDGTAAVSAHAFLLGESQSLGSFPGRPEEWAATPRLQSTSQKTYEIGPSPSVLDYAGVLSQKNGCGTSILVPQPI